MLFKLIILIISITSTISLSGTSNYTSLENFGRIFSKSSSNKVCSNPVPYGFVNRVGTYEYYMISDILMNWIDGENFCQKYEAHLPSIASQSDLDYLRWLVGERVVSTPFYNYAGVDSSYSGYWLGGYRSVPSNAWKWTDGSLSTFRPWIPGQPDFALGKEYFMHDLYDRAQLKYLGLNDCPYYVNMWVICKFKC